jgi:hypothetical protein
MRGRRPLGSGRFRRAGPRQLLRWLKAPFRMSLVLPGLAFEGDESLAARIACPAVRTLTEVPSRRRVEPVKSETAMTAYDGVRITGDNGRG